MTKETKLELLNSILERSKEITTTSCANPIFRDWKILVERNLLKIFGAESIEVNEFKRLKFFASYPPFSIADEDSIQHVTAYSRSFETTLRYINQYKNEFQEEPENEVLPESKIEKNIPKIKWQGTQKELAELFIELNRKGWIDEINSDLIQHYFSESNTIKQVLKPNKDKQGIANYDAVYTKAYKPKFDLIRMKEEKK